MKKLTKRLTLLFTSIMLVCMFCACGSSTDSDMAYVKEKGVLVVGITDFAPMDFKDASGNWVGFDADMAKGFAESLGVKVEFVEIEWGNKILELDGKTIDCVWNGMTLTDEVKSAMSCSNAYCNNAQIVILPADKADEYQTVESLKGLNIAVEIGSAGEAEAIAKQDAMAAIKTYEIEVIDMGIVDQYTHARLRKNGDILGVEPVQPKDKHEAQPGE